MDISKASPNCTDCSSFFHPIDACPKRVAVAYTPVNNITTTSLDDLVLAIDTEWHYRNLFSQGIPHIQTGSCSKHATMRLQSIGRLPLGHPEVPLIKDAFRDGFVLTRTLLPICRDCMKAESGIREAIDGLDYCKCATLLATAPCSQCVIAEINGSLKFAVKKREMEGEKQERKVKCRCGGVVEERVVQARQCVYCKGVATAPFRNYAGAELIYGVNDAVPCALIAGAREPHEQEVVKPVDLSIMADFV